MNVTSRVREIETNAVVLCRTHMPAPWGMRIDAGEGVMFHIVREGACWLVVKGSAPRRLEQGDLVLLPQGLDHDLVDDPATSPEPLAKFLSRTDIEENGGAMTTLICGVYLADVELAHPMLLALPPVMVFPARLVEASAELRTTLALLTLEVEREAAGGEALVQHLFDALFVYLVRAWSEDVSSSSQARVSGLKEPALTRALSRIHAHPAKTWTVDGLAREAGLSRAAFAKRFAEQVGEPPLAYVTRWRMVLAIRLLNASDTSLATIAERVGYESEFAFSRAFKRTRGVSPSQFRQMQCPRTQA